MLETIRAFALERLRASGEESCTRARHAAWCTELVLSREAWVVAYLPQGHAILDQLETEYANLHGALTWLRECGDVSGLLTLAGELLLFWQLRGHLREGRQWLEWGMAQADAPSADTAAAARARGQFALSTIAQVQHDSQVALVLCEASLRYSRAAGDAARIARAAAHAAIVSLDVGGAGRTDAYLTEALAAFETLAMCRGTECPQPAAHLTGHRCQEPGGRGSR